MLVTAPIRSNSAVSTELGPITRAVVSMSLTAALLLGFGFADGPVLGGTVPGEVPLLLLGVAVVALVMTPKELALKIPISVSFLAFITWVVISLFWSVNPAGTQFELLTLIPLWTSVYVFASILEFEDLKRVMIWIARFLVITTLIAGIVFPETRLHLSGDGTVLPGWHGFFIHKNGLTPVIVLGLATTFAFDTSRVWRASVLIGSVAILFLSSSVTGISAAIILVPFWIWLGWLIDKDARRQALFVVTSVVLFAFLTVGVFASIGSIVTASGKDLSFSGRTDIWSTTVDFIAERPITGWGLGGLFDTTGAGLNSETMAFWRSVGFDMFHAHNGALDLTLQLGVVGLAMFTIIAASAVLTAWKLKNVVPAFAAWMLAVIVVQAYTGLSEATFLGGWFSMLILIRVVGMRLTNESRHIGEAAPV